MFMCSCSAKNGQWSEFDFLLSAKKIKVSPEQAVKQIQRMTQFLENIQQNTISIKQLHQQTFENVLIACHLPVSYMLFIHQRAPPFRRHLAELLPNI